MKFAIDIKLKLPRINKVNILGPVLAPITKLKKKTHLKKILNNDKLK